MKRIPLTRGLFALVDDADYETLKVFRWKANKAGIRYAYRYFGATGMIRMHQQLLNPPKGMLVDHINHDGLDNRRENIRICTSSQNGMNQSLNSKSTSGFKGVSTTRSKTNGWRAYINTSRTEGNRKQIHLGSFKTKEEAALAYNVAAIEMYEEFACLNNV